VSYHQRLPLAQIFGGGTMSSSDGQRFPTKGKSLTDRICMSDRWVLSCRSTPGIQLG
jgi:TnpA family transposase